LKYRGRFAPSPTGPLHAGSLVAALASWLDARAHGGSWLVRIEDVDRPRCPPGTDEVILGQLAACALTSDEAVRWQSTREADYAAALQRLLDAGHAYPCGCTRAEIDAVWAARGVPQRVDPGIVLWHDRRLGAQRQDVAREVGDFVLRRADGLWAYQLAVVVDDAAQGITDVVRGADLADNTPRQIVLQHALGVPTPRHLHTPLVLAADGQKLSKQTGARALALADPVAALAAAGTVLGLPLLAAPTPAEWLARAVPAWAGIMRIP
jgi:glutamyl-Q tRNA(Asp) synthetase